MSTRLKKAAALLLLVIMTFPLVGFTYAEREENFIFENITVETDDSENSAGEEPEQKEENYIKWVDFNVGTKTLLKTYELAKKYYGQEIKFDIIEVLSYLSVKNGNRFGDTKDLKELDNLVKCLKDGKTVEGMMRDNKYYPYYKECYDAIFSDMFGEIENDDGTKKLTLKAYFPLSDGFWFNHYDDFGSSRSYGYKRRHLGHDIMGGIGTPIIAVEGGTVTELGWNRFGGWRVGVLSRDKRRYYYYAHLRKDRPFAAGLSLGADVEAGQVIGYLGQTGYSTKENVNLKTGKPHLHIGLQLIFHESQIKGSREIWIDLYSITNLLNRNRVKTVKDPETKEYTSIK